jgi:cell division protein FtsB
VDIEDRLKRLQSLFSYALSGAVAAKARYLALRGDLSSTPAGVARAKMTWQQLEARKTAIIAHMVALEDVEQIEAPEQTEQLTQEVARDYAA